MFLDVSGDRSTESLLLKFLHVLQNEVLGIRKSVRIEDAVFIVTPLKQSPTLLSTKHIDWLDPTIVSSVLSSFFPLYRGCADIPRLSCGMQCGLAGTTSGKSVFK